MATLCFKRHLQANCLQLGMDSRTK